MLDKTGGLFRLAVGLMAAFSERDQAEFRPLVDLLALYFQIRDDLVNLRSDEYARAKSYCEDLTEGARPASRCFGGRGGATRTRRRRDDATTPRRPGDDTATMPR